MNYDTFPNQLVQSPSTYYPAAIPPDHLERYGSEHLDLDIFGIAVSRLNKVQQLVFVRKVMGITACQFLTIAFMIFIIVTVCPLFEWLQKSTYTWYIPLIPAFIIAMVIIWQLCVQYSLMTIATRMILLTIFSLLMALVASNLVSKLAYREGILVIVMSGFGITCSFLYTFQKRYYFRGAFPFVCSFGAICLSSTLLRYLYDMDPLEILFPIMISGFICSYVIFELYYIMKNVTSDDYLLANVYLFVDLVYPMRFIHHFCELTDNMNMFPDILYPGDSRV